MSHNAGVGSDRPQADNIRLSSQTEITAMPKRWWRRAKPGDYIPEGETELQKIDAIEKPTIRRTATTIPTPTPRIRPVTKKEVEIALTFVSSKGSCLQNPSLLPSAKIQQYLLFAE